MKLYLDSSRVDELKKWRPVIHGATTNPTILLKDGLSPGGINGIREFLKECGGSFPVSVEISGEITADSITAFWKDLGGEDNDVVIKVPLLTPTGGNNLAAIRHVAEEVPINCTALFSTPQVLLALEAGARYVSLFVGRLDDEGMDWKGVLESCMKHVRRYKDAELITASMRTVGMVMDCVALGADITTVTPAILEKMVMHRFSLDTVKQFERDSEFRGVARNVAAVLAEYEAPAAKGAGTKIRGALKIVGDDTITVNLTPEEDRLVSNLMSEELDSRIRAGID